MLDLKRLRLLRELQIRGTIAAVAEAERYSPSSVSAQLALLEREAGVPLLRRAGRRVVLTAQAETLVGYADELIATMERAESALAASRTEVTGTVRVAVFQSAALALLPGTLRSLADRFPQVRVEMVQHEPESALHETWAGDFDVVVAEQYPGHATARYPGLVWRELMSDAIRLAVPSVWQDVSGLAGAADAPWVMEPPGAACRHWGEQACRLAGFEPDVRFETADLQAQIRLVESGNAVGLIPDLVWAGRDRTVRLVELPGNPRRTVFTAVRASGDERPAVVAVREALGVTAAGITGK
ncbi:LysR family transcriptional regulator [Tersicoccus phoenicis]|uniref:LysR family transcriptional regulator n=1 Tax=Tersicoccus phoenicis TaxID=554083 RepID=A0A1R1L8Z3_9MICC|nr:LysR substrate-binding domain-containing protein [Tersicoccus phoenicis]OMH23983.1 LysR family transcriptional regulator [Tersicoccus phoenicis]